MSTAAGDERLVGSTTRLGAVDTGLLERTLDTLVPAVDDLPGAGGLGLAPAVVAAGTDAPLTADAAADLLHRLDPTLADGDLEAALRTAESDDPAGFRALLVLTYGTYYADPRVRQRLERSTGYPSHPPQPTGYRLPTFDEDLLARQRARAPFWRPAGG